MTAKQGEQKPIPDIGDFVEFDPVGFLPEEFLQIKRDYHDLWNHHESFRRNIMLAKDYYGSRVTVRYYVGEVAAHQLNNAILIDPVVQQTMRYLSEDWEISSIMAKDSAVHEGTHLADGALQYWVTLYNSAMALIDSSMHEEVKSRAVQAKKNVSPDSERVAVYATDKFRETEGRPKRRGYANGFIMHANMDKNEVLRLLKKRFERATKEKNRLLRGETSQKWYEKLLVSNEQAQGLYQSELRDLLVLAAVEAQSEPPATLEERKSRVRAAMGEAMARFNPVPEYDETGTVPKMPDHGLFSDLPQSWAEKIVAERETGVKSRSSLP